MPVGAIVGSTVVGVGASVAGSNAQKKAAQKASDTSLQAARENNALSREFYERNTQLLSPYSEMGLRAGATLSELLLGPAASAAPKTLPATGGPMLPPAANDARMGAIRPQMLAAEDPRDIYQSPHMMALRGGGAAGNMQYGAPEPVPGAVQTTAPAPSARSAWDTFRDSTNYQFRLNEGTRAINQGYAAGGALQSGAALKALTKYGQDYASNELSNYMNMLAGQQGMGLNAARAVAGVGGDMVSQISGNNNSAASAAANAALLRGNATAGMYGDIAGGIGRGIGALGALGGSSYSGGAGPVVTMGGARVPGWLGG